QQATKVQHYKRPAERFFTKEQRDHTTILFGGLTFSHERLIQGAWKGLGYNCEVIPTPDVSAFQLGKEYGNNGQCNPTYFTVGNLIQYLQGLEEKGVSRQDIQNKYLFLTAGACGPCRFGMYESEYRIALRNSGFEDFRVMLFQQSKGLTQNEVEAGLDMNLDFFLAMLNGMNMGDMLNEIAYMIRPFEIEEGKTDETLQWARDYLHDVLRDHKSATVNGRMGRVLDKMNWRDKTEYLIKFKEQLTSDYYVEALKAVRDRFDAIEVDRFRVKPVVKITGEFWAQTTEGDGNFNMFRFLEREGAEVIVEPIGTWIMYMIHQYKQAINDRKGVVEDRDETPWWRFDRRLATEIGYRKKMNKINLAERIYKREYDRLQGALGGDVLHELACQYHLQRVGHPYYNSRAGGGEGHLEVAKNIYYTNKGYCHMVLSLKPFGCMPSTQSDGVQAAVMEHHKDMIFLPIETSGEGEINAHSRVQMALGNARVKAKQEFAEALEKSGRTLDEMRAFVDTRPEMKRATYAVPKQDDVVGRAANFVLHVAELMKARGHRTARVA
ncbi:MAG: activator of (R)-2-hydroxyglutaryl-CoA dehydratase, partial [Candidatus Latescibacterota bacterium]